MLEKVVEFKTSIALNLTENYLLNTSHLGVRYWRKIKYLMLTGIALHAE